jgi:hypothetical protein
MIVKINIQNSKFYIPKYFYFFFFRVGSVNTLVATSCIPIARKASRTFGIAEVSNVGVVFVYIIDEIFYNIEKFLN